MKNKKYVSFALAMATAIGTAAFNPDIVNAEENNASEVVAVDEATEAVPEETAVEEAVDENVESTADEAEQPVEGLSDEDAALMEKCKNLTPFTELNGDNKDAYLVLVETKTGINIYRENEFVKYNIEPTDEYYYNCQIENPEVLDLVYSTDGNEDISEVHLIGEVGAFNMNGPEMQYEVFKGYECTDAVDGEYLDPDGSYFKTLLLNPQELAVRGEIESLTPGTRMDYSDGEGFYGGGYVFYSKYDNGGDVECNVGYDIQRNEDGSVKLTIGAYNQEKNFATAVEYDLLPGVIAYRANFEAE